MESGIVSVGPPPLVYRVARRGRDPFAPPPWDLAWPDGTFGNRFDDPGDASGLTTAGRFRTVYCATTAEGALGETVARFRPSVALLAGLLAVQDDEPLSPELEPRPNETAGWPGAVPEAWRLRRVLATAGVDPGLRFADLSAPQSHRYLRRAMAGELSALGLDDLDFSTVSGSHRSLTQRIARHLHEQRDRDGHPRFAGLRYLSRLNLAWECWAIFYDRLRLSPRSSITIAHDNVHLLAVCTLFELGIETKER